MADRLELMLEAERRGILPPNQQELLNEARSRGIVGASAEPVDAPAPAPAQAAPAPQAALPAITDSDVAPVQTLGINDPQPVVETRPPATPRPQVEIQQPEPGSFGETALNVAQTMLPGFGQALPENSLSKALTVAGPNAIADTIIGLSQLFGQEAGDAAQEVVPKFTPETPGTKISSDLIRFGGAGAGGGMGLANLARTLMNSPNKTAAVVQWLSGLVGASAGDFAVTDAKQDKTLSDAMDLPGPFATEANDSDLEVKGKIAGEGAVVQPAVDLSMALGRGALNAVKGIKEGFSELKNADIEAIVQDIIQRTVRDTGATPQQVADAIDETITKSPNAMATTGQASDNVGLQQIERGLRNTGRVDADDVLGRKTKAPSVDPSLELGQRGKEQAAGVAEQVADITNARRFDTPEAEADKLALRKTVSDQVDAGEARATARVDEAADNVTVAEREAAELSENEQRRLAQGAESSERTVSEEVEGAVSEMRKAEKEAFEAIPGDTERKSRTLKRAYQDAVTAKEGDTPADKDAALALQKQLDASPNVKEFFENLSDNGTHRFADAESTRKALGDIIEAGRRNGENVERATKLKQAVSDETAALAKEKPGTPEKIRTAQAASDAIELFKEQSQVLRKDGTAAGSFFKAWKKKFGDVGSKEVKPFLKADRAGTSAKKDADDLLELVNKSPDPGRARQGVTEMVMADMASKTRRLTPEHVRQYANTHSEFLKRFPETRDLLGRLGRNIEAKGEALDAARKAYDDATKLFKDREKAVARSAAKTLLDTDDAAVAIGKILDGDQPLRKTRELIGRARQDPTGDAMAGLRQATDEWLNGKITKSGAIKAGDEEVFVASLAEAQKLVGKKAGRRQALEMIYGKKDMEALDEVHSRLQIAARKSPVTTGGSDTGLNEATKSTITSEQARVLFAAYFGITKGRAMFTISRFAAKFLRGGELEAKFLRIMTDTMLDPQKASAALRAMPSQKMALSTDKHIRAIQERASRGEITERELMDELDKIPQVQRFKTFIGNNFPGMVDNADETVEDDEKEAGN